MATSLHGRPGEGPSSTVRHHAQPLSTTARSRPQRLWTTATADRP